METYRRNVVAAWPAAFDPEASDVQELRDWLNVVGPDTPWITALTDGPYEDVFQRWSQGKSITEIWAILRPETTPAEWSWGTSEPYPVPPSIADVLDALVFAHHRDPTIVAQMPTPRFSWSGELGDILDRIEERGELTAEDVTDALVAQRHMALNYRMRHEFDPYERIFFDEFPERYGIA